MILLIRHQSPPGELWGRREVCHCLGAAGDAGSPPPAFSPPPPGSASFRVADGGAATALSMPSSAAGPRRSWLRARSDPPLQVFAAAERAARGPGRRDLPWGESWRGRGTPRAPLPVADSVVRLDLS